MPIPGTFSSQNELLCVSMVSHSKSLLALQLGGGFYVVQSQFILILQPARRGVCIEPIEPAKSAPSCYNWNGSRTFVLEQV